MPMIRRVVLSLRVGSWFRDGGGLVVAGGQAAPLLDLVDAPFDGVSLFVSFALESWRAPTTTAEPFAVRCMVDGLGDPPPGFHDAAGRCESRGMSTPCPQGPHEASSAACRPDGAPGSSSSPATRTHKRRVVRLAGQRPRLAGSGRVLVGTNDRGVDRDDPVEITLGIGSGAQRGEEPLPGVVGRPLSQQVVDALPRTEVLGQGRPGIPVRYLNTIAPITCR